MYLSHIFILMLLLPLTADILLWFVLPRRKWRWISLIPNALMLVFFLISAILESKEADSQICRMWIISVIVTLCTAEIILLSFLLISRIFKKRRLLRRSIIVCGIGICALFLVYMLYAFTLGQKQYVTTELELADRRIPKSFDGYRIAFISDLHVDTQHGTPSTIDCIVNYVNSTHADLILFGGDIVTHHSGQLDEFITPLSRLSATDGVISVLGNHDYMAYISWNSDEERLRDIQRLVSMERGMGWKVLLNRHRTIRRGGDSIAIIGVQNDSERDDARHPRFGDLKKAMRGLNDSVFKILVSHDPSHWRRSVVEKTDIPLTLSGHTHGMQLSLPFVNFGALFFREYAGAYHEKDQMLYVTSGIGTSLMRARFVAWPEVVVVTLRSR